MAVKLTKRTIDALPFGPPKGRWDRDDEVPGFFIVSYPTKRTFFVRYQLQNGRRKTVKIGVYGNITPDEARKKARGYLGAASMGQDPQGDRRKARKAPTWGEWVDLYLGRVRLTKKSPRHDERFLGAEQPKRSASDLYLALRRRWKARSVDSITTEDLEAFRAEIGKTHKTSANRWLASVRACLAAARRSGYIAVNPALGLQPYREAPARARVLSHDELERLLRAVMADEDEFGRAGLLILVETGARLSEVLRMKWEDLDLEAEVPTWRIPSPKSGHPQVQPLADSTVKLLRKLPRPGPWVVTGRFNDKRRADLVGPWRRALEAAGLSDAEIHIHDLRRTFGLHVAKAAGLHVASKLLRHADVRVTERVYAPLGLADLKAALEKRAEVLPFDEKKKTAG